MSSMEIQLDLMTVLNTLMRTVLVSNNEDKTLWSVWHMTMTLKERHQDFKESSVQLRPQFLLRHCQGVGEAKIFIQPDSRRNVLDGSTHFNTFQSNRDIYVLLHKCAKEMLLQKNNLSGPYNHLSLHNTLCWELKSEIIDCRVPLPAEGIGNGQFKTRLGQSGVSLIEV